MSLINDMLRDLENRRRHERKGKTFTEIPVAVKERAPKQFGWWLFGVGGLLLATIIWVGITFFPVSSKSLSTDSLSANTTEQSHGDVTQQSQQAETAPPPPSKIQNIVQQGATHAESLPINSEPLDSATRLLGISLSESVESSSIMLNFNKLPEYRLIQGSEDARLQLVINFNEMQLGGQLDIPEPAGELLRRVSLRPQKNRLQLLIDLAARSEVQSYELKENNDSGYSLQLDIRPVEQPAAVVQAEIPEQKEVAAQPETIPATKPEESVAKTSTDLVSEDDAAAHLHKSSNRISPDKKAYQIGLEQLRQGSLTAAERSFVAALEINPALIDARLQLIETLQQQDKLSQAQQQMRESLAQNPESLPLRKTYARSLLADGHHLEAIKVLRSQPLPAVAQDLEYHALLAALLQETRQFGAAAQAYAGLLQIHPEKALWWFGLAVSMDQSGDFDQARNAYRRALALPGLSRDVQKYVQKRLQIL